MYIFCFSGFLLLLIYCITIIIINKEIPNSISQTVYMLPNKLKWIFTIILFAITFMIAPRLFSITNNYYSFLVFFTLVGILGVGVDPLIKGQKNIIHYSSAIMMGISSQILVYIINPYILLSWIPYIIYTIYIEDGRKNMFFAEIVMLICLALLCLL